MAASGSFKTGNYEGRYLQFTWEETSQSIANNTTTISWKLKGAGTGDYYYLTQNVTVKIDGKVVFHQDLDTDGQIKLYNGTLVASGTHTFTHAADGTKSFTAYAEAGIYNWAVNCTGEGTFDLDTIPRASSLTAANGTLGVEQTLTINRASNTFKHRLLYKCGDVADYIAGSADAYTTATSIKWTPPMGLAHENTAGTSVSVKLTLYTYTSDGTHIGTATETITCVIPTSVKPSCSIAWEDVSGAAGIYDSPVQGISKLKITLTEQTSYSSPIASRSISANGAKYTTTQATTDALAAAGESKISATVTDKRGRSGSASVTLDVLAYKAPTVSRLTVHRCDEDGTENDQGDFIEAKFTAAITSLGGKNSAAYLLRIKNGTDNNVVEVEFTDLANVYVVADHSYIFAADGNSSYDVEVVATDNHGSATRATNASTAFTLLNWHPKGNGMGVGKVSEKENTMEVALDSDFQGPVYGRAYGLGVLPAIPEGADIHTYTTPGIWAVRTNAIAETLTNLPHVSAGRLIVSAALGQEDDNSKWRYIEQRFIPHNRGLGVARTWIQYITTAGTDEWIYSGWTTEALEAYPVGSIYLAYNHTNPATLFGGTWARISSYLLRGVAEGGTIGETGTLADGSGRTYINISIWRRTA